jgi:hypothetical protein
MMKSNDETIDTVVETVKVMNVIKSRIGVPTEQQYRKTI